MIEILKDGSIKISTEALFKLIEEADKGKAIALGNGAKADPGCLSIGEGAQALKSFEYD